MGATVGRAADTFAASAGLIVNLDLMISVDTLVCHLAGALGEPVWTGLRKAASGKRKPGKAK